MIIRAAKTSLVCIALLLAVAAGVTAQAASPTIEAPAAPTASPTTAAPAAPADNSEWYINKPIKSFEFVGLVTIKGSDLDAVLKPYIGQAFSIDPLLMDIQAKLYALDYFESIEPNALPGDDARTSMIIQLKVKERPAVIAVEVKGNVSLRTTEITDKILLKKAILRTKGVSRQTSRR